MATGETGPAPPDWEDDEGGREVEDGAEAAAAVLQGEPLVILRSESADAQAEKVDALRAALHGRPIRVLRLDGKHPRGVAPLATPEPETDRAVLVVEHADTLDPATLDALRDVENLQLVLFHREDFRPPRWTGGRDSATTVRFPPGHLIAFELDPRRTRWRALAGWGAFAVATAGVLAAAVLFYELREPPREPPATVAAAPDAPPPAAPTAPAAAPAAPDHPEPAANFAGATPPAATPAPSPAAPEADAVPPAAVPPDPAPLTPAAEASEPAPPPDAAAPPPPPAPAASAAPEPPPPASRAAQRAQLRRDFDRFLASDRDLPRHLTRSQRRALFDKFLEWRAAQAAGAPR